MRSSMIVSLVVGLAVVGGMAFATFSGNEQEERVTLDQVPAAVKATILLEASGAEIKEIERETKDGKTVYEADFLVNGAEVEIKIAPDGTLLGRKVDEDDDDDDEHGEDDITLDQVPEPARTALLALAGNAQITKAQREQDDGVVIFEAAWVANGTKREAAVTAEGTLIEMEEIIATGNAPASVRAAIAARFGPNAEVVIEKKMIILYGVEGLINGEEEELLILPTGHVIDEPDDDGDDDDGDDEDDDGDNGDRDD